MFEADQEAEWCYRERKAKEEAKEKGILIVAKNLKLKSFPLDAIADSTGISIETLKTL